MIWLPTNSRHHFLPNSPLPSYSSCNGFLDEPQNDVLFIRKVQNALPQVFMWFTPFLSLLKYCHLSEAFHQTLQNSNKNNPTLETHLHDRTLFFFRACITM